MSRSRCEARRDRETIKLLREAAQRDRDTIDELQEQVDRSLTHARELDSEIAAGERIAAAQRALIARLRSEVGDAAQQAADVGRRLAAAEGELVDLRAIRDALLSPTFVQRDGLTVAAQVFPAEPHVGGDFYYVGDGAQGSAVLAVGDVGLGTEVGCDSAQLTLAPGDGALLFTDGIIEARGTDSRFGSDRLHRSLDHAAGGTPDRIIASLKADLDQFAESGMNDDVCLLAARVD